MARKWIGTKSCKSFERKWDKTYENRDSTKLPKARPQSEYDETSHDLDLPKVRPQSEYDRSQSVIHRVEKGEFSIFRRGRSSSHAVALAALVGLTGVAMEHHAHTAETTALQASITRIVNDIGYEAIQGYDDDQESLPYNDMAASMPYFDYAITLGVISLY